MTPTSAPACSAVRVARSWRARRGVAQRGPRRPFGQRIEGHATGGGGGPRPARGRRHGRRADDQGTAYPDARRAGSPQEDLACHAVALASSTLRIRSAGRGRRVGQGPQEERGRGRARVLVADRSLAEIGRPPLGRQDRDRRGGTRLGGGGDGRGDGRRRGTPSTAARAAAAAGTSASSIVFSPVVALPSARCRRWPPRGRRPARPSCRARRPRRRPRHRPASRRSRTTGRRHRRRW